MEMYFFPSFEEGKLYFFSIRPFIAIYKKDGWTSQLLYETFLLEQL